MSAVLRLLRRDHVNLERLLRVLERQLSRFERAETPDYDLIADILDYCAGFPDRYHHLLEDRVLEALRRRDPATAERVGDLDAQHEALAAETKVCLATVNRAREDMLVERAGLVQATQDFLDAYRAHIAMEEDHFFPAAEAALGDADWSAIEDSWTSPLDPVFGDREGEHYRRLRREILAEDEATGSA